MKNKIAEQLAAKQNHRNLLRTQRRAEPLFERPNPELIAKPSILIVCEGENTEPSYFNQFRLSSAKVKSVGIGYNTVSLVYRALYLSQQTNYDQVWCVFDKDDFNDNDFNDAIKIAQANNFGVAYSNQAFEYWLILHFDDHQGGGMHRDNYKNKINKLLKSYNLYYDGSGSKIITNEIFELLEGISNGKCLMVNY